MTKGFVLATVAACAAVIAVPSMISAQTTAPNGGQLFRQRCAACHAVVPGGRAVLAPNLAGVVGRKAGSTTFAYSPALKSANITWTRANLDKYLTAPAKLVPGTRMVIALPDARQRAAVLDYLTRPTPTP